MRMIDADEFIKEVQQLPLCPFCGGKPKLDAIGMMSRRPVVYCTKCHAIAEPQDTIEDAIEAWNRRIESAPVRHGEWTTGYFHDIVCTACTHPSTTNEKTRYCPHCGAFMDGGEKQ